MITTVAVKIKQWVTEVPWPWHITSVLHTVESSTRELEQILLTYRCCQGRW